VRRAAIVLFGNRAVRGASAEFHGPDGYENDAEGLKQVHSGQGSASFLLDGKPHGVRW
jgi:hypothetical protein